MSCLRALGWEYSIRNVAQLLGVSPGWIKLRESQGILPEPHRTPGGHRAYRAEDLAHIREIAIAQGRFPPDHPNGKTAEIVRGRIAVLNQKGGVGKTTITLNLAFALGDRGIRCLMVDLDRQANLTQTCGVSIEDREEGLGYALFRAAQDAPNARSLMEESIRRTFNPRVDLLPTNNSYSLDAEDQIRTRVVL